MLCFYVLSPDALLSLEVTVCILFIPNVCFHSLVIVARPLVMHFLMSSLFINLPYESLLLFSMWGQCIKPRCNGKKFDAFRWNWHVELQDFEVNCGITDWVRYILNTFKCPNEDKLLKKLFKNEVVQMRGGTCFNVGEVGSRHHYHFERHVPYLHGSVFVTWW